MLYGTYLVGSLLGLALLLWPEETLTVLTLVGIQVNMVYINYRLKFMAWRLHRSLVKLSKQQNLPDPGPFRFVNIWDRDDDF